MWPGGEAARGGGTRARSRQRRKGEEAQRRPARSARKSLKRTCVAPLLVGDQLDRLGVSPRAMPMRTSFSAPLSCDTNATCATIRGCQSNAYHPSNPPAHPPAIWARAPGRGSALVRRAWPRMSEAGGECQMRARAWAIIGGARPGDAPSGTSKSGLKRRRGKKMPFSAIAATAREKSRREVRGEVRPSAASCLLQRCQ